MKETWNIPTNQLYIGVIKCARNVSNKASNEEESNLTIQRKLFHTHKYKVNKSIKV
jgi:hypothetical protein